MPAKKIEPVRDHKRYFIVGTEGSGHHIFHKACDLPCDELTEEWTMDGYQTRDYDRHLNINLRIKDALILTSLPYGKFISRPNLMNYIHWTQSNKQDRMIYIYRDPVLCAESASQRFDKHIVISARHILDALVYISAVLRHQKETYPEMPLVFEYNDICENPDSFERWTGIKLEKDKLMKSTRYTTNNRLKDYFFQSYELYSFIEKCVIKL